MIGIQINGTKMTPEKISAGTAGSYYETINFSFTGEWVRLNKKAVFYPARGKPVEVDLGRSNYGSTKIPSEVMAHSGIAKFVVSGYVIEDGKIDEKIITTPGFIDVDATLKDEGANTYPPTPNAYEALNDRVGLAELRITMNETKLDAHSTNIDKNADDIESLNEAVEDLKENGGVGGGGSSGVHIGPDAPTDGSALWVDTDENGGSGGGSGGGVEPLIGTTDKITPSMVVEALQAGRQITLSHTDASLGTVTFNNFGYSESLNAVVSSASFEIYLSKLCVYLIGVTGNDRWNCSMFDLDGGGSCIDVTAEVGQTIVVKEVDGDGKPTAWEAVDLPSEGLSNQPWEVIDRVEVTEDGVWRYNSTVPLREFKLTITVPAGASTSAGGIEIYKGNREFVGYSYQGTIVNTKSQRIVINSRSSHGESYVEAVTTQWDTTTNKTKLQGVFKSAYYTDVNDPYNSISVYSSSTSPFPIGTIFELQGVR